MSEEQKTPQIHSVYNKEKFKQSNIPKEKKASAAKVTDLNKSYESMGSNEKETPHYNFDSDGEPPTDQVGDKLSIVKRQQVTKTILEVGANNGQGKPGKPYIVTVGLLGYFAKKAELVGEEGEAAGVAPETKKVTATHIRIAGDALEGRGEVFVDHEEKPIKLTLGDDRLPYGLWKSIEHMRKGEKARIMIKPAWGYNSDKNREVVFFPRGWDQGAKKEALMKRRVFFEVVLHDWITRHDILGNGLLVKTLLEKGRGFDRPAAADHVKINLKMYQKDQVFVEKNEFSTPVSALSQTIQRLLESMKQGEKVSCLVQPAYYIHVDKELRSEDGGYPEISEDMLLHVDLQLLELQSITDLHQDGTTLFRTLKRGDSGSTASPFHDCKATLLLKIEIDDEVHFDNFENGEPVVYDLEAYQCPAVLRRVLKQSKLNDVVEITSKNRNKLFCHLADTQGIFDIEKMSKFQKDIKMTFKLLEIEQKMHVFKILIHEKVARLEFLSSVARQLANQKSSETYFQLNFVKKAEKAFMTIGRYFRNKDAKTNFLEEDIDTLDYRNSSDQIDLIHLENFKNFAQILLKQNKFGLAFEKITEALDKIDHKDYGCNMIKIAILMALNRYSQAQGILDDLETWWPDKAAEIDVKRQEVALKYQEQSDLEKMMYRNMFGAGPKREEDENVEAASGVKIIVEELKKE